MTYRDNKVCPYERKNGRTNERGEWTDRRHSDFANTIEWRKHHRLRGSASPVLTATGFVNGKRQFSTPHRIDTPQPITKKFVTGDYVGDPYGCAKLGAYPSKGGFWAHG